MRPGPWPYSRKVPLNDELEQIAAAATVHAAAGETLAGILAAEPIPGERVYLCAFEAGGGACAGSRSTAPERRSRTGASVRDAASIAALCELAEETAAGGDLDDLVSRLVAVRMTEAPRGNRGGGGGRAHLAARRSSLRRGVASPAYLDRLGRATRRLERALGEGGSPFAEGMKLGMAAVDSLTKEIEETTRATFLNVPSQWMIPSDGGGEALITRRQARCRAGTRGHVS